MRIIVTGGAGFIGSHIVDAYIAAGHDVVALDSLWAHGGGRRENVHERASFVHMDIRDEAVKRVFQDFKPDMVSHHAAQHSVAIGSRDPQYDANVNVLGLLNVLETAAKAGTKKVIFASSGATFGTPEKLPMNESTQQHPESPYGITKMVAEHYLRFFKSEHGLEFTALRYGNIFGPRQDPNGEAGVIGIFIQKFLNSEGVRIDWDGEQTRDYMYVGDIAELNLIALERGNGGIYCIGTNRKTSVNQIYKSLVQITGFQAPITQAPKRAGDARDAQFDASLANRELGWSAKTDLIDGMKKTVEHFKVRAATV